LCTFTLKILHVLMNCLNHTYVNEFGLYYVFLI
jgi:hypothetical protein